MFSIPSTALPDGLGFAGEIIKASTHASTHLDAPWHYAPTFEGEPPCFYGVKKVWDYSPYVLSNVPCKIEDE